MLIRSTSTTFLSFFLFYPTIPYSVLRVFSETRGVQVGDDLCCDCMHYDTVLCIKRTARLRAISMFYVYLRGLEL